MGRFKHFFAAFLLGCLVFPACSEVADPVSEEEELRSFLYGAWQFTREDFLMRGETVSSRDREPGTLILTFSPDFGNSCLTSWYDGDLSAVPFHLEGDHFSFQHSDQDRFLLKRSPDGDAFQLVKERFVYPGNPDKLVKSSYPVSDGSDSYCHPSDGSHHYYKDGDEFVNYVEYRSREGKNWASDSQILYFVRLK